jgi:hypothetical protein
MKAIAGCITIVAAAILLAGCSDYSKAYDEASSKLVEAQKQNQALQKNVDQLKEANLQCQQQVMSLQGLTPEQRKEAVPSIVEIKVDKRSGIYPSNKDKTELVIYVRPIDDTGDAIKAAGPIHVELWDLGSVPADALLNKWDVPALQIKDKWSGALLAGFYRLAFEVPKDYATRKNLTLKVTFTDLLTGRSFTSQTPVAGR